MLFIFNYIQRCFPFSAYCFHFLCFYHNNVDILFNYTFDYFKQNLELTTIVNKIIQIFLLTNKMDKLVPMFTIIRYLIPLEHKLMYLTSEQSYKDEVASIRTCYQYSRGNYKKVKKVHPKQFITCGFCRQYITNKTFIPT